MLRADAPGALPSPRAFLIRRLFPPLASGRRSGWIRAGAPARSSIVYIQYTHALRANPSGRRIAGQHEKIHQIILNLLVPEVDGYLVWSSVSDSKYVQLRNDHE